MFENTTTRGQYVSLGLPMSGTASAASVRALPTWGEVSAVAVIAKRRHEDPNPGTGFTRITDGADNGAFRGTSAWRPPT